MDLLSAVGMVTKRRADYFGQAESLAKKTGSQEALEERMTKESKAIVKGLRDKQLKWEEYERTLYDKTLVSALAAVYLGAGEANPRDKMEKSWPTIVGDMMPFLVTFLDETKSYIDQGMLRIGDQTQDFADVDWDKYFDDDFEDDYLSDEEEQDSLSPAGIMAVPLTMLSGTVNGPSGRGPAGSAGAGPRSPGGPARVAEQVATSPGGVGRTWRGLLNRVARYIATPTFGFFNLGRFMRKREQGFREMRRVARMDKGTCVDCIRYDRMGWQPIGTLPMPGHECRCHDRCRCHIEYR
jgi:hypothetical protein